MAIYPYQRELSVEYMVEGHHEAFDRKALVAVHPHPADRHAEILALAKQHPCTRDFSNHMFSGDAAYEKGWIWSARESSLTREEPLDEPNPVLGFFCVRHKVRVPATSLYFVGVHPDWKGAGLGDLLLDTLEAVCPNPRIELNCRKDNERALAFYRRRGFTIAGESLRGEGWALEKEWDR